MKTCIATTFAVAASAAVVTLGAASAFADPNIDMSEATLNNGKVDFNINSYAGAGAQIQGTKEGTITAEVSARNNAWAFGRADFGASLETDNAGPGVQTFGGVEADGAFRTGVNGEAFATTTGRGESNTAAATFGEAGIGFDGTFDVDLGTFDVDLQSSN